MGYVHSPGCRHWDVPLWLAYGVCADFEAGFGFAHQYERRLEFLEEKNGARHVHKNGVGDLVVGAKWRFLEEGAWIPRQALVPSVKFPTADEHDGLGSGEIDYDLMWIASKALTDRLGAHANAGYSWIGDPDGEEVGNLVHGGLALDYLLTDTLQAVGEVFAEDEVGRGGGTAVQYNAGFRWQAVDGLVVDAAVGSRICGDGTPDFTATVGLTWAFGFAGEAR